MPSVLCGLALLVPCCLDILLLLTFVVCTLSLNFAALQKPAGVTLIFGAVLTVETLKLTSLLLLIPVGLLFATFHLLTFFGAVPVGRKTEVALFGTHILLAIATIIGIVYPQLMCLASLSALTAVGAVGAQFYGFFDYYCL